MQILLLLLTVTHTWQSQDACALTRHSESCKQSSWSPARNSQENGSFFTASGVGTPEVPPGPLLFMRKGLEFAPQQMPSPNHCWWEADGKQDGKLLGTSGPEPRTQPLHYIDTHTHRESAAESIPKYIS